MYGLDLFSGIGGITKALEGYVEPVAYCEIDRYSQSVLLSRMSKGDLPMAPIWDDITTLRGFQLPRIDIVYGGFPCQDLSVAGHGEGLAGKRSGLFFEIARLVCEIRPQFVFLENISAITVRGAERVIGEFCRLRYDCRWGILSAKDVGAPHFRERWFMLAKSNSKHGKARVGDQQNWTQAICRQGSKNGNEFWLQAPPKGHGMGDGVPYSVDSVRALGNAVVPAQAREAFERLMGLKGG